MRDTNRQRVERVRGYVKERQRGANLRRKKDEFFHVAERWAETEGHLRSGLITIEDVRKYDAWDCSSVVYQAGIDEYD